MPNEKNLIPLNQRSKSEQREICSSGGRASGAARRRKRNLKDAADLFLSLPPSDKRRWNALARKGVNPEDIDNQMAMIAGLTERAIGGDAKAAKVLIDLLGDGAKSPESTSENNLLEILRNIGEVNTNDLPEVE